MTPEVEAALREQGARAWVHAVDLDSGAETGLGDDELVVTASVFKIPVLVELCHQYGSGRLRPEQRVRLAAGDRRTPGGVGTSVLLDDVELSLRDLSVLMMSVSDNRATDVILDLVGLDAVNARMAALGLHETVLVGDCQLLFDQIDEDLPGGYDHYVPGEEDLRLTMRTAVPASTSRSTPRETTRLLAMIWTDQATTPDGCAEARRVLGLQVWPHRLSSGWSADDVTISAKTGTIAAIRNEAGVVELPDGGRVAVAVFVRNRTAAARNPDADRLIGSLGRAAVDRVRAGGPA
ncbi:serine hydrolase [Nocardioides sp. cx-173]|uniref:serine hydrolase n=1 Tax=Nocardioides sp. cx-173 TaxID=2898796 RepID=UPI001E3FF12A|nr:serine hydrolase [Nocardioides sp. cx-173]MCD4524522.1 class A beta-lactamase-related serine hydrolase [Nocardioides sp. cx-173]UGB42993.1 class A beta-lactamase-related serine hydrolase [Nocardioides sp. cx-173]